MIFFYFIFPAQDEDLPKDLDIKDVSPECNNISIGLEPFTLCIIIFCFVCLFIVAGGIPCLFLSFFAENPLK
jgi:hypothetical protein